MQYTLNQVAFKGKQQLAMGKHQITAIIKKKTVKHVMSDEKASQHGKSGSDTGLMGRRWDVWRTVTC